MPIADLAIAALVAVTVARLVAAAGRPRLATVGLVAARRGRPCSSSSLGSVGADEDNEAYAASGRSPDAASRATAVRAWHPLRERLRLLRAPGAAGTARGAIRPSPPQPAFDFFFFRNRLSCGVWLPGDESALADYDIDLVAFHRGMYEQGHVPGAWFGWQGLVDHGFSPARGGSG